jgi:glyoxylase-like metal-dependent hydrolase (beta-lactamase superfamily II)
VNIRAILAPNPGPFTLDGTRTYLLGTETAIDPGPPIMSHIAAIARAAPALKTILVTHRHADHAPAAVALRRLTGARILAPVDSIEGEPVDRRLAGGERIGVADGTILAVATPGHTGEHICFLSSGGDLFTGDTILGAGTTAIFPPDGDMAAYMNSLAGLRSVRPRRILPGHGPVHQDALRLIDYYIAHRLEREQQILEQLGRGPASIEQLRSAIYPGLAPALVAAAESQLLAHLIKLGGEGRARAEGGVYSRS